MIAPMVSEVAFKNVVFNEILGRDFSAVMGADILFADSLRGNARKVDVFKENVFLGCP